jgi:alkylation response protein AidB-like acyl-CoA dehydrogenase
MSDSDALRESVRSFLEKHAPVRSDGDVWPRLTSELGLTGLAIAEEHGGSGATWDELAVVLQETGRVLLRAPYLSTVVAAAAVEGADLLPGLADGSTRAALALEADVTVDGEQITGSLPQVVDAPGATLLLVGVGETLYAVGAFDVAPLEPLDVTRPQGRVELSSAPARPVGRADHARDLLHVALAAESVGAMQRCLELTVEHLKTREQFGRPLGSFQALRHRVADLTVAAEAAASTAWYAARAATEGAAHLPVSAPLAKATAADAFTQVAGEMIQLHGGIGFTWEHDAHLYFKRAWTTALLHGDSRSLRRTAYQRSRG